MSDRSDIPHVRVDAEKLRDLARCEEAIGHSSSSLGSKRMRLYGIPIQDDDLRRLIFRLVRFGQAKDVDLASRIGWGITSETALLALSAQERDAILRVLDDPPAGLIELRGALAREHRNRNG